MAWDGMGWHAMGCLSRLEAFSRQTGTERESDRFRDSLIFSVLL
jgi:hypothetical protein